MLDYLKEFVDIYRDATELLSNPPATFTAASWKKVGGVRENALYQIAVLLDLPNLPRPSKPLSLKKRQQCLDFMANQETKPCP